MKRTLLSILLIGSIFSLSAVTKVAYVTFQKTMDATATTVQNDPIIQMLSADPNLQVTVKVTATKTDVISDLADYDVIIVQEALSGDAGILQPSGSLALKTIPKPFIYNKSYSLKQGRALTTSTAAGGKESNGALSITVESAALTNDLFKACTIGTSNEIVLFNALTNDAGLLGDAKSIKSLNYSTGNVVSGSSTILAVPSILSTDAATVAIAINDIPAETTIDSEKTISRMIALSMNFGAISATGGKNITDNGLTIWRNAVYMLAGLTVPSTKATLPTGFTNPTLSSFSFDGKVVRNTNSEILNVYNVTGKLITASNKDIDMSNLVNGVYFIKGQNNSLKVSLLK